jgi:predicted ATPase
MVERFPDGVYFAPLASVADADVMWTSIAEVLDVPTDARQPPRLLDHVAHRNALFVLDNLEQIKAADTVVSELLDHASQAVIVATSRKPLALEAEYVHPVPPLDIPGEATFADAEASEAVQLFVQQARKATPRFRLTSDNAADVVEVCRRLDGLPLAIELAAARVRLLSPAALLRRLDHALDLTATGRHRPARQQTLRETIAWSYDLLDPTQQALFRCLGVFAGGADLEAISDVAMEWIDDQDPLDVVASLVDASLARISEGFDGEPRVHLLTTVRAFALEQLAAAGELADVQRRHAEFYLTLAEFIGSQFVLAGKALSVRERLETEQGNFREALSWAFLSATDPPDAEHVKVGLRLAAALSFFWFVYGYLVECRRWLEQGIEAAAGVTGPEVAAAMLRVGWFMDSSTESEQITMLWSRALTMSRRLGTPMLVAEALRLLASLQGEEGDIAAARALLDEAIAMAAEGGDSWQDALTQCWIFVDLANLELRSGSPEVAGRYSAKVRDLALRHGIEAEALRAELDIAWALALAGRGLEALAHLNHHSQPVINNGIPLITVELVWAYSAAFAVIGNAELAATLQGTHEAALEQPALAAFTLAASDRALVERCYSKARHLITADEWQRAHARGRSITPEQAVANARRIGDAIMTTHAQQGNGSDAAGESRGVV